MQRYKETAGVTNAGISSGSGSARTVACLIIRGKGTNKDLRPRGKMAGFLGKKGGETRSLKIIFTPGQGAPGGPWLNPHNK